MIIKYSLILFILIINLIKSSTVHHTITSKRLQIQQASFAFLTATGYRASLDSQEWCEEYLVPGGRPYKWSEYRGMSINYLDLYISLQFDPICEKELIEFRKLYIDNIKQPLPYQNNTEWWENTFLITALNAFTCDFNGSKLEDFEFISSDIRKDFNTDKIKQKVWHMIGDYITSEYKQRENANRRYDYDAGLYVPFLDKLTGNDYSMDQHLRIGYPSYMGRHMWFIFHTVAQRISDSDCDNDKNGTEIYTMLTKKVKDFILLSSHYHPCPICREHEISRILVNDRYAKSLIDNEAIRYYPIEHLLMGGIRGDTFAKLSTIIPSDKSSSAAFFWKLHNAITASVDNGCQCFTQESEDTSPYKCVFDFKYQIQQQFPRQQRSFPFAKRFEFVLSDDRNYTLFSETRDQFKSITSQINKLDTFELRKELFQYWNSGIMISLESQSIVDQLQILISNMTSQFINSGVLSTSYSYESDIPLKCNLILEKLNSSIKLPSLSFKDTSPPAICSPYIQPSVCDQQYIYKYFTQPPVTSPPKSTKNVQPISSSSTVPVISSSSNSDKPASNHGNSNLSINSLYLLFSILLFLSMLLF